VVKGRKSKKYTVDFSGVDKEIRKRGGRHIPDGDYMAKIVAVERRKNKAGDAYYFSWKVQIIHDAEGGKKYAGTPFYYTTSLKPEALFNLRNLIFACSDGKKNVSGKVLNFDPNSLIGSRIGIIVEDEEYEGKLRSTVADIAPPSELFEEDEDEDEDDDDDDDDDEDDDEEDEDDDEDEEDDDDDDDEDDDEPEPVKKKSKGKAKKGKKRPADDDDDDLEDIDEDEL